MRTRLSRGAVGALALTASAMSASIVAQTLLARTAGASGLGEYHATTLFVIVVATLVTFGLPLASAQRSATREGAGGTSDHVAGAAAVVSLPLSALGALVAAVAWTPVAERLGLQGAVGGAVVALAVVASVVHSVAVSLAIARLRMRLATWLVLAQPLAVGAGVLAEPALGLSPSALAAIGYLVSGGAAGTWLIRSGIARPDRHEIGLLMRRSAGASAVLHTTLLANWGDRAIVALLAGPLALGNFAAASIAAEAIQRLPRSLGNFGVPAYARLQEDPAAVGRVLGSHVRLLAALFVAAGTFLVAAGPALLTAVLGQDFALARTTIRLLGMALLPNGIAVALASAAAGVDSRGVGRVAMLVVLVHFVVATVATSLFSIAGTALAQLIVWSLVVVLYRSLMPDRIRPTLTRTLARISAVAAPSWTVAWMLGSSDLPAPIAGTSIALISGLAMALLVLSDDDRRLAALVAGGFRRASDPAGPGRRTLG